MKLFQQVRAAARRHPHADIAMAAVAFGATILTTLAGSPLHRLDGTAALLGAIACAALVVRRRSPVLAFAVSVSAAEAYLAGYQGNQGSMVLVAPLIALYTVADLSTRRRALGLGVVAIGVLAGSHLLVTPSARLGADNLALAALGGLAVAAGDASRSRRNYLAEVEARAQRAERDREAEAARRVTDERLRIARELHDVVGHQLALISVQAGVAGHLLDVEPARAREALGHVRRTCKGALAELRDTIGLLRQPGEPAAPIEPAPGLTGLDGLLGGFVGSGLSISRQVSGEPRPIPVAVDLTAYRVIQESLTNVRKHAGPTSVTVRLGYRLADLEVVVDNRPAPAPAPAPGPTGVGPTGVGPTGVGPTGAGPTGVGPTGAGPGPGHGLVGMRERVGALGGTLSAGPRPDGGYRVTATLPLPVPDPEGRR